MLKSIATGKLLVNLLAIAAIIIMVGLGNWQLDRAAFKAARQALFQQRILEPVRALPGDIIDADDWGYTQVTTTGYYQASDTIFIDNVINKSVAGVLVVTPFKPIDSDVILLVNRGWLPWGADRRFLPQVDTPVQQVSLSGRLISVSTGHFYLADPDKSNEPGNLWLQLDLARFKNTTKSPVQPLVLVLDADQPGSQEHIWELPDDIWVARHKGYAVQWFALAATLLILTLVMNLKTMRKSEKHD